MIYETLEVKFELNNQNEYQIVKSNTKIRNTWYLFETYTEDTTLYVNDLDKLYIYIIKSLLENGYAGTTENIKCKTFSYVYKSGKCSNIKAKNESGTMILFVNFKSKFGVEFGTPTENAELINYAISKGRLGCSLGADAYNEFIRSQLPPTKYNDFTAHAIFRQDIHYPIFEYSNELLEAKQHVSGYQMCIQGEYNNLIEYDLESSYPAQLLCDMPCGLPNQFATLEEVPQTYFKVITFTYYNLKPRPNKIDFLEHSNLGEFTLTERLFELFKENYQANIIIKQITAFKTQKSPFRKFITANIIQGKKNEPRKHIAKYNKYIGNSIIGYMGRNTETVDTTASIRDNCIATEQTVKYIEPLYLPVYLSVLDKAKSAFIKTIQRHQDKIVYANTDGFLSTAPIDTELLNANNSLQIGNYRQKNMYTQIYIECINGYAGILDTGEIDNTISGMTLESVIEPDKYRNRNFEYYINEPTPHGTIRKTKIKLHQ